MLLVHLGWGGLGTVGTSVWFFPLLPREGASGDLLSLLPYRITAFENYTKKSFSFSFY